MVQRLNSQIFFPAQACDLSQFSSLKNLLGFLTTLLPISPSVSQSPHRKFFPRMIFQTCLIYVCMPVGGFLVCLFVCLFFTPPPFPPHSHHSVSVALRLSGLVEKTYYTFISAPGLNLQGPLLLKVFVSLISYNLESKGFSKPYPSIWTLSFISACELANSLLNSSLFLQCIAEEPSVH